MAVKFVKYGLPYYKQITWTPAMDGPVGDDPFGPGDNPTGGGGPGGGTGGGGGGFGGQGGGYQGGGNTGGGGTGGGYVPGGSIIPHLVKEETIAVDYDTQCVKIQCRRDVIQQGSPSLFYCNRASFGVLEYTGNDSSEIDENLWESGTQTGEVAYKDGGRLVYDFPTNPFVVGDPADGLINPQTEKPFNENYLSNPETWSFPQITTPFFWVKVTRSQPRKWLAFSAHGSSQPAFTQDYHLSQTLLKLTFNEDLAEQFLGNTNENEGEDGEDTGTSTGGTNVGPRLDGPPIAMQIHREPIPPQIVEYDYTEPAINLTVSYPENVEAPSGMLFVNLSEEDLYVNLNFTRTNLELNRQDVIDNYDTEFTEFIPEERYLFSDQNEYLDWKSEQ